MVITKLMGGLGNQMFQYAFGRRLAHDRGTSLKLDLSFFLTQALRRYELGDLDIQEHVATAEEIAAVKGAAGRGGGRLGQTLRNALTPYFRRRVITERKYFQFDPGLLQAPDDVYLDGYWQNAKYFSAIESILRREFTLKQPIDAESRELSQMIRESVSVGIHVRRGDFISDSSISRVHGTCDLPYYIHCMRLIAEKCEPERWVVFSDDPEWARRHLRISDGRATYVGASGSSSPCRDLMLLSRCRHFIIANSTFSWWAAWLSDHPGKIVCAPKRWFAVDDYDTSDLFPVEWVVVPSVSEWRSARHC
jgi:hypothetical protein